MDINYINNLINRLDKHQSERWKGELPPSIPKSDIDKDKMDKIIQSIPYYDLSITEFKAGKAVAEDVLGRKLSKPERLQIGLLIADMVNSESGIDFDKLKEIIKSNIK